MNLSNEQVNRYKRHLILPEVGVEGQKKLLAAKVLCIGDACVLQKKPNVYGSIFRFEGMVTVFAPHLKNPDTKEKGPCYRCLYPEPPDPGSVPSCAEGGVLGVICGAIGSLQATEVVKLILGIGRPAIGRLLTWNSLDMEFRTFKIKHDHACPVCGDHPTITKPIDYEQFCGVPILDPRSLAETAAEVRRAKEPAKPQATRAGLDEKGLPIAYKFDPAMEITPRDVKSMLDKGEKFVFIDC